MRKTRLIFASAALIAAALLVSPGSRLAPEASAAGKVDFAAEVQPIFKESCYQCHGPDQQMGQLRLDSKQTALAGGQSGKVIQPGDADESVLYQRVAGISDQARMPMGGELPPEQIDTIRRWIDQGAEWPEQLSAKDAAVQKHWAFVPPGRAGLPEVENKDWPRNPIDRFVLARLEKEGLSPSPEAGKATLLRRLSLDLTGLPPEPEQVDAFLRDNSPDAYRKQVERLLSSPHYGERWGRHWLDAARYADSDGFEKDKPREVWFYRDWVVRALNQDMPYDQFVIEQLAGDLLPNPTQPQLVATGFLRNSMINEEGGIDPEQFRMEAMFDRMDAVGKSILGVTIQCAQCHNHKYDPLTQQAYYQMFAFLNNSHEANIPVYTREQQKKRRELFAGMRAIEDRLKKENPDWRERMAEWEEKARGAQPEWIALRPEVEDISTGGQKYLPMEDGSFLAQGFAPTRHRVKMTAATDVQPITGFRLELMTDPNLPQGGPGRSLEGLAALTEFEVEAAPKGLPQWKRTVPIVEATADINPAARPLRERFRVKGVRRVTGPVEYAIDGCRDTAWGIDAGPGRRNQPRKAVFVPKEPIEHPGGLELTFYLDQSHGGPNANKHHSINLGRMRLSVTTGENPKADPLPKRVRDILSIPMEERTEKQIETLFSYWRTTVPEWKEANAKIEKLWEQHPEPNTQLVLDEREHPRATSVLERGDFLSPKKKVTPGVPEFLHPLPEGEPLNRLTFAKWLVSEESPTTARSIVNRVWMKYFGRGLVNTPENLGTQSEPPSHPKLLDWLAVEFMDSGWRLKDLHRLIVTSATYRQSSDATPELRNRDPYNVLLARGPRVRVEAEIVRDIALAASGLLNPKMGGPSVYPPAPRFLFDPPASYGEKRWDVERDGDRYRRSLYTFHYRSVPYPPLQVFDAPDGSASVVKRDRSNTPLQALTTLNEATFMEAARALALKTVREAGPDERERLAYAFRRCLTREPKPPEAQELLSLLEQQRERFERGELDPWMLAANDPESPPALPEDATPEELAAWTAVSRVLLNLDETITKE